MPLQSPSESFLKWSHTSPVTKQRSCLFPTAWLFQKSHLEVRRLLLFDLLRRGDSQCHRAPSRQYLETGSIIRHIRFGQATLVKLIYLE